MESISTAFQLKRKHTSLGNVIKYELNKFVMLDTNKMSIFDCINFK